MLPDMESNNGSDIENMTIQLHAKHCKDDREEAKKQNSNWSMKTWIWRISNAAMVVFFVSAAYVQVCTTH